MEAYRDNIPEQSKLADSISFYGTIELFCSFKKLKLTPFVETMNCI